MPAKLTKKALVREIAKECYLPQAQVGPVVDAILNRFRESLLDGQSICLTGFGTFKIRVSNPRKARNINTGEFVDVPSQRKVDFEPAVRFATELNQ